MSKAPCVSVIIPTYNRADFLPAAIRSVLAQTYKNVEIIVVDDGSTDDTGKVVIPFGDRIKYIRTANMGPAHARNVGMKAGGGKYIAFLDSDDAYLPEKLDMQVSLMESEPEVGMVFTDLSAATEAGVWQERHLRSYHRLYDRKGWSYDDIYQVKKRLPFSGGVVECYIGDIFRHVLMDPLVPSFTILFPREILEKVGYQNEAYRLAEDYEFIVRVCKRFKAAFLDIPTYVYRYHAGQVSVPGQPKTKDNLLKVIRIHEVFLQAVLDWGCGDAEYYSRNRGWLNARIAELYQCIGGFWMEYGDAGKGRECFKKGLSFDPHGKGNRKSLYLSFLPSSLRRVYTGTSRRIRRWT
ncbi:MAG: glycosyltransferase family 2 protein [Deltaproteobacteria bacterium]|nr:glycosyltransferase family 2 protein [Deltaproteobacteria bacterium]